MPESSPMTKVLFPPAGHIGGTCSPARARIPPVEDSAPFQLFAGNGSLELAQKVAMCLGMELSPLKLGRFNDGEISLQIPESCRNEHVFIVQSTSPPVNETLMELLIMVRTFRRASARTISAVIPYYGYARQDRKTAARVPISASDVAMLMEAAGVDRVLSVDLHCAQIQGFFHNLPVDNLTAQVEMCPWAVKHFFDSKDDNFCVVSPDAGGVGRAKVFLEALVALGCENGTLAITIKHRSGPGSIEAMNVVGEVAGRHCLIVDDICDTAGTMCKSADTLIELGALSVSACVTHPVFSPPALDRIAASKLRCVLVSDSIPLKEGACDKIKQVSLCRLLAESIRCITSGSSISSLFMLPRSLADTTAPRGASPELVGGSPPAGSLPMSKAGLASNNP